MAHFQFPRDAMRRHGNPTIRPANRSVTPLLDVRDVRSMEREICEVLNQRPTFHFGWSATLSMGASFGNSNPRIAGRFKGSEWLDPDVTPPIRPCML
jgi:hypothetical protein